jgi:hypothetical protein
VNRPALTLALVSALFLGASLGFMGGVLFANHQFDGSRIVRRMHEPRRGGQPGMRMMPSARVLVPWLQRELALDDQQVTAIRSEIERSRTELASVHDSVHARIARHLTTEQRERFQRLMRQGFPGGPRGRRPPFPRAEPGRQGDTR